jgi:hypothetical protein
VDGLARDKSNAAQCGIEYDEWQQLPDETKDDLLAQHGLEPWDADAQRKGSLVYSNAKTPCDLQSVLHERFDVEDCGDRLLTESYAYLRDCPRCGEVCQGHQMCLRHINELQDVEGQPNFMAGPRYNS